MKLKKFFSTLISVIMIGCVMVTSYENVSATQSRTDYFNKNYTLGSSQADNVAIIAEAQIGRTMAQMGYSENWCADFVADCGVLAGISNLIPANGVVSSLMNNIKNAGGYEVASPQRGDIVFYYCTGCKKYVHTGVMLDSVYSAEGNVGGKVQKLHANYKDSSGHTVDSGTITRKFIRPNYASNRDPMGYYDSGSGVDYNTIRITGWTFDPDEPAKQLYVHVYVGGNSGSANAERITKDINGNDIIANAYRQDVDDVHHCGAWHGIDTTIRTTKTGSQEVHIYAIDTAGGNNPELGGAVINIPADPEKPVISDVKITNITEDGYTVYCTVTDNHKLQRVSFPTWPTREENGNDQDDIVWHDYSNDLNTNSVTAWYRVKTSEHKNEHGYYRTHIYAYDQSGNWTSFGIGDVYVPEHREHIPADIFEYNGNIYVKYDTAMAWTEADELCKQMGGHLVTISNQAENDEITKHLSSDIWYWIGLSDSSEENHFVWSNGEPQIFSNWNTGEPNNTDGIENYAQIVTSGKWNDNSNEPWIKGQLQQLGFILEIDNSAILLDTTDRLNMNKYDFYKNLMPYSVAEYYANSKGGHLITITSAEENAFIAEKLKGWTWLALNDKENEGTFKWTTGETLTYTNWNDGEPNDDFGEDNAAIKPTGQWNDNRNNNGFYFAIEYDNYYGDINSDGIIDDVDATLLLKHISDISKLNAEQLEHADVNNDNKIDLLDAVTIQ